MIPPSFLQDLLNRVDIVDVVGRYVQLKKGGANFMGLCPFHNEKSPSFTVSPTKQFYHCFGCGAHGTAIGFLMEHAGLSFPEAVNELAQSVGLTVPQEPSPMRGGGSGSGGPRGGEGYAPAVSKAVTTALSDVMQTASDYYRTQLRGAPNAIQYLKKRGLTGEIAKRLTRLHQGIRTQQRTTPWLEDELVVVAAAHDPIVPRGRKRPVSLEALSKATWLLREPGSGTHEIINQLLIPYLHRLRPGIEFGNPEAIKRAVASGLGITCLSRCVVADLLESGALVAPPTELPQLTRRFYLVMHERKKRTRGLDLLMRYLESVRAQPEGVARVSPGSRQN